MAGDAGTYYFGSVAGLAASSEANLGATALTTGTGKAFFFAPEGGFISEYGVFIQTNTSANSLVLTLSVAPQFGGSYTTATGLAGGAITSTGPSAGLTAGQCLRRFCDVPVNRGNLIRLDATTGVAAGTGMFYMKFVPAGDSAKGTNDVISTT